MNNRNFKEGTIIKGYELKNYMLCKVLPDDRVMRRFQYKIGMNEDVTPFNITGRHKSGLRFCFAGDICSYLDNGTELALITIPDDEDVYVGHGWLSAYRIVIEKIISLNEVLGRADGWECLMLNGTDITAVNNYAVAWVAKNGYLDAVKFLYANGADISADSSRALRWAAGNGHLEVVKYLHEHGADITAYDNYAVKSAAYRGHLEVVKYLHGHGADITADNNCAVKLAAGKGYPEVVKYLCRNGAGITVFNHFCTPIQALKIIIWKQLDRCIRKTGTWKY